MDEKYRLIFRGELLDGQHRAVVKRRLSEALKLKDGQVEKLFSGQPVVIKRDVDRETAARYQSLFKKAGCQLQVKGPEADAAVPEENTTPETARASRSHSTEAEEGEPPSNSLASDTIDAPDFEVQSTWFAPPEEPRAEIDAPDFSVAALGSELAEKEDVPVATVAEVDFGLAEVGADLLTERTAAPVVELGALNFEVAEVGADIGAPRRPEEATTPDISHLSLAERV